MLWFKNYANTPQRPEVQDLSDGSFRLWYDARCYIAATETDGFIPAKQVPRFGRHGAKKNVTELLDAGLWEQSPTGFIDLTWGGEQQSAAQAEKARAASAQRQSRWRNGVSNAVSHASRGEERREEEKREEVEVAFLLPRQASA